MLEGIWQKCKTATRRNCLICWSTLFIGLCALPGAVGQSFQAEGVVEYKFNLSENKSISRTFSASVDENGWFIRVNAAFPGAAVQYYEAGYDGEHLYKYAASRDRENASNVANPAGNGIIESNPVPGEDGSFLQYIWLALASHDYFAGIESGDLVRPMSLDEDDQVVAEFELSDKPPFLPKEVLYLYPTGTVGKFSVGGWFRQVKAIKRGSTVLPV